MNFFRAISDLLRFDRTNWKALALCFFAAAIFWIFNAFNKDYATNLRFPIKFEFDNDKYVAAEPLPATLTLNVSGHGWDLFRNSLGVKVPTISMSLERPWETHKIAAATLTPMVASQVGALQLNYIVIDTLRLNIEPKTTRKVRLQPDLTEVTFKRNYGRTSAVVTLPDSVVLEGPKSFLDNLRDTILIKVSASRLDDNFRESVEVALESDLIKRNPPVAEVMFEVGLVEEIVHPVKLTMTRLPWGMEMDSDSVNCVFIIPRKDHDLFISESSSLLVSFELGDVRKGQTVAFMPRLTGLPVYASLVHIDSVKVKRY